MRIERIVTMAPFVVLGRVAHAGASHRAALLSAREVSTLRAAERIAARLRVVLAANGGHAGEDHELARLEHAAAQLAEDGGIQL